MGESALTSFLLFTMKEVDKDDSYYDHQSYNHTLICFGMVLLVDNQCSCCNVLCVWEIFATFAAKALLNFGEYINLQRPFKSNYDICQKISYFHWYFDENPATHAF